MNKIFFALFTVSFVLFSTNFAHAKESKWEKFDKLSEKKKEKLGRKAKKKGDYYISSNGAYKVHATNSGLDAYKWALLLNSFAEQTKNDGIFPKDKKSGRNMLVYILSNREEYAEALDKYSKGQAKPGESVGQFLYFNTKKIKPALFAYSEREDEQLLSTMLYEGTHQIIYIQMGEDVPIWFSQGFATNMQTYEMNRGMKANLYNAAFKSNRAGHAAMLVEENKLVPFNDLFFMTKGSWNSATNAQTQDNFSSAWATCNFFFTTKKGRKFVDKLMKILKKGGGVKGSKKMLNVQNIADIEASVKEHIKNRIIPTIKRGKALREVLVSDYLDVEKAEKFYNWMQEDFPEATETKFYAEWVKIIKNEKPEEAVLAIQELCKKDEDFFHPELNYILALGYSKAGDTKEAKKYLKKAEEDNYSFHGVLTLKDELK